MRLADTCTATDASRLRLLLWGVGLAWSLLILLFIVLGYLHVRREAVALARLEARNTISRDLLYRRWASNHGGIYVPATEQTPPNPYLAHIPERDLVTPSGRRLTLVNPAYMTRQVYELETALDPGRPQAHITSDTPLNPVNAPDPWEETALRHLAAGGGEEYSAVQEIDGRPIMRMLRPMYAAQPCLKCHAVQGYKLGDQRGALSVSIPVAPFLATVRNDFRTTALGLTLAWGCGLAGIWYTGRIVRHRSAEQTRHHAELLRSERKYRQLFENMTTGFALHEIVCDAGGNPVDYRFVEVNPAFEALTGLKAGDLVGHSVREVMPKTEPYWIETFGRVAQGGAPISYENYSAELGRYYDTWCFSPGPGMFAVVFTDTTERRRIVAERERLLVDLEAKNRELEGLIYSASHDLRSPLVNIHGFGQRLERHCRQLAEALATDRAGIPAAARELIEVGIAEDLGYIRSSVAKMNGLIDGLLRLSRLGRATLELKPVDMNALASEVIRGMRYQIDQCGAVVTVQDLPPCRGDATQLGQVLSNLLDNALKYRQDGRPLRVAVDGGEGSDGVFYRVTDNGRGIAPECRDRLCEVFYRVDPDRSPPGEGLGLTLIQRIVARHGGRLQIASTPGAGSVFTVFLPANIVSEGVAS